MYRCAACNTVVAPRTPQHRVVVQTRHRDYRNEEGEVISHGYETVKEIGLCPDCARASNSTE